MTPMNKEDRYTMVTYDISKESFKKLKRSPVNVFRRLGIRVNLSCWILKHSMLPTSFVEKMREVGCNVRIVRYDKDDHKEIIAIAKEELEKEAVRIRESLGKKLEEAKKDFETAERTQDGGMVNKTFSYVKVSLRNAKNLLAAAEEAATAFDLLGESDELFKGVRKEIAAQQELFFAEHAKESGKTEAKPKRKGKKKGA